MEVYTDGSYNPITGECTFAYIFIENERIKYEYKTTKQHKMGLYNTYAELKAIMYAVKFAKRIKTKIVIHTDYCNVIHILAYDRKRYIIKNAGFINSFREFMLENKDVYEIKCIKAHSNNKYNNYVDRMCRTSGNGRVIKTDICI